MNYYILNICYILAPLDQLFIFGFVYIKFEYAVTTTLVTIIHL